MRWCSCPRFQAPEPQGGLLSETSLFSRQKSHWGPEKQQVLARSSLLVAGVGGVGSMAAELLVRCGIGKLVLVDNKVVDLPDLSRQALYNLDDLGQAKVQAAARRLGRLTGATVLKPFRVTLGAPDPPEDLWDVDGCLDCLDNFRARFALEEHLVPAQFLVHGALRGNYGQVTTLRPGQGVSLRALYRNLRQPTGMVPVAAPIVYALAVLMAQEAMHNLWGTPQLAGELLVVDLNHFLFQRQSLAP